MRPYRTIRRTIMVVALLVTAFLISCLPGPSRRDTPGWMSPAGTECPTVVVNNQAFADITLRHPDVPSFREQVTGLTTESFQDCRLMDKNAVFHVDAVGDAFEYTLRGATALSQGTTIQLYIAMHPRQSRVVGQGYGAGDLNDLTIKGLTVLPGILGMHLGIYYDIVECLELPDPRPIEELRWAVAEEILEPSTGRLMYGAFLEDAFPYPLVVIEAPYFVHPTVVSHEIIHFLGYPENDEAMSCVMGFPDTHLPGRYQEEGTP